MIDVLWILLGVIVIVVIVWVVLFNISSKKKKSYKKNIVSLLEEFGMIQKTKNSEYLKYIYNDKSYLVVMLTVWNNEELVFNSETVWQVGTKLLNKEDLKKIDTPKIVIVYPNNQPIKRYINENEMEFVKDSKKIWNMHVIKSYELEERLKRGISDEI